MVQWLGPASMNKTLFNKSFNTLRPPACAATLASILQKQSGSVFDSECQVQIFVTVDQGWSTYGALDDLKWRIVFL